MTTSDYNDAFIEARFDRFEAEESGEEKARKQATLSMWLAAEAALRGVQSGSDLTPEIATWIENLFRDWRANVSVQEFDDVRTRGGSNDSLVLVGAKQTAVTYVQAVLAGDISDPARNKTIQIMYEVSSQTVRDWIKELPCDLWSRFRPNDSIDVRVKYLRIGLKHDSNAYRTLSKSHKAIGKRPKKPPN